jgi:septum site-determining protein MinC
VRKNDVLIKGTKEGILVALGEGDDYLALKRRLDERLRGAARFLRGSEVTLDAGGRLLTQSQVQELETLIASGHGLRVLGVRHAVSPTATGVVGAEGEPQPTVVVRRSLRSGQRVAFDGNLVVFGDVHPGAEVVATGDIVVMGGLSGMAHAGARGTERAVVVALRLWPTQLRIGHLIARRPDGEAQARAAAPEVARVRDGQIVVEPLETGGAERRETAWAKSS